MVWFSTSLLGPTREPPTANALGQYQPAGNNETPLAREDLNSDVIVNAQLTHLISRDDAPQGQDAPHVSDVPMPDVPAVHDIATARRTIGGRCRKWCISAQPPAGKRKCAACSMCGTRFTHGEARLQQWSNRQTNNHYVHAHCVNGGLGHDHELHPKVADDQEAVDAVTRQRDTNTRTAADTEVPLPFAQDPDQASTVAPPDDERDLLGREEALRMDEEIMNFQWFEHVTWDSIKDLRGTTYVQPPMRFRFALQQAQHAILRAIVHNNPTSPASESAWKALVLSSWLLLGRPAVNASESNCAHFLDARLELFWAEDWSALWAMVRAECDVAPVQNTTRRTDKQQMQSRVRKVATLARTGEKGRAWQLPEMHIIQSHSGVKVFIEQEVPALTRVVNGQTEHAWMDLVFNLNGSITYLDVSIVALFSSSPSLVSAASTNQDIWPRERRRANLTGTQTSISFLSSLRPQVGLAHMRGNSLATSCEMLTTHQ